MTFVKGQSGNPAGRPRGTPARAPTADIKALAGVHGPEAVETLRSIMQNGETHAVRISAARELLDRGFGRATEHHEHIIDVTFAAQIARIRRRSPELIEAPTLEHEGADAS